MAKGRGYIKIFELLRSKRASCDFVSIDEITAVANLKLATARVYFRNRLKGKFLQHESDGSFSVTGEVEAYDESQFVDWMSQNVIAGEHDTSTDKKLIENANQSMLSAIEIHNM